MISHENRLFCRLDGLTATAREQQRMAAVTELGLLQSESIPVFEEATQTIAQVLELPICILGLMETDQQRFKSAVGLSTLGLMNTLATSRQIARLDSFCTYVVDSQQTLAIEDTLSHPVFASSSLTYQYGVRSYLGVPLISSAGFCIGTLAVLDITPHCFTSRDIALLQLMARWCMSEFEQQRSRTQAQTLSTTEASEPEQGIDLPSVNQTRVELLGQLTQELRTPLTSVMGMASVLNREIYGPLTSKQKEYLNIIHNSGQYLLSLMNEIIQLAEVNEDQQNLNLSSVDVEMLCQQAIASLEQAAQRREQQIRLTVEPGKRIWLMDKDKVRQMLYHLMFSVIQTSTAGSIIRLHSCRKENYLTLSLWVSHPWLGEGLSYSEVYASVASGGISTHTVRQEELVHSFQAVVGTSHGEQTARRAKPSSDSMPTDPLRKNLGLLLSQQLAEFHGGKITMQGEPESGYRYVINLPLLAETSEE
jgi:signal transduction histidine kinase